MNYIRFTNPSCEVPHDLQVTLFPSRRAYLRYNRTKTSGGLRVTGKGTAAKMFGYDASAVEAGDPNAELVFYREQFTPNCIAHEVTHGLLHIFRQVGRADFTQKPPRNATDTEELFALLHGMLTENILIWRNEMGLV